MAERDAHGRKQSTGAKPVGPVHADAGRKAAITAFAFEMAERMRVEIDRSSITSVAETISISTRTVAIVRDGKLLADELLSAISNPKKRAAWVPLVARAAKQLGRNPRDWVERAGFDWEDIGHLAEARKRQPADLSQPVGARSGVLDAIERRDKDGKSRAVRATVIDYGPFAQPLGGREGIGNLRWNFNTIFIDRLVGTLNPTWRVEFEQGADLPDLINRLVRGDIHLAMGLWDMPSRRRRGLRFLRIPGWNIPLAAFCLVSPANASRLPTWTEICDPIAPSPGVIVAVEGPESEYVLGTLRFDPKRLVTCPDYDVGRLTDRFVETTRRLSTERVILLSDEQTCRDISLRIAAREDIAGDEHLEPLRANAGAMPSYPLSIALRDDDRWYDLVERALSDLFDRAPAMMARLYSEVLCKAVRGMSRLDVDATYASWQVHDDWRGGPFVDLFIKELADGLRVDDRVCVEDGTLLRLMKTLLPDWHARIDETLAVG